MRKIKFALLTLVCVAAIAVPAFATPGSPTNVAVIHARGTIDDKVKVKEPRNRDFVHQQITILAGGHTGWHTHPGAVLVTVKTGTLAYISPSGQGHQGHSDDDDDDDHGGPRCTTRLYPAGSSFVDPGHGHVHIVRNAGATSVELWVTYTGVPPGGAFRIDAPDPGC